MNQVDGKCQRCGAPCRYTGELPILCGTCKAQMERIQQAAVRGRQPVAASR